MTSQFVIKKERYQQIISKFSQKKIMVMGDMGIDRYTIGTATRLSPEAPVPVVAVTSQYDKLSMAANVADNLKIFGCEPFLTSLIGPDRVGKEVYEILAKEGISAKYVFEHSSRRTSLKERIVAQNQHVVRIDHESIDPINSEAESFYLEKILPSIDLVDGIIFEDYAKGLCTKRVLEEVIDCAKKKNKFVSVDPPTMGTRSPSDYRGVSFITPNLNEAMKLSGVEIRDEASLYKAGENLLKSVGCSLVIITQGASGMTIFSPTEQPFHIPTFARDVFDVSGAGDTVISMFTLALVSGASVRESAILSNFAAGVEVGKAGTATVTLQELEEYMVRLGGLQ